MSIFTVPGKNMFYVAVHEFGHALGLDHSNVTDSVMFPYDRVYNPDFMLHSDDIQGIQVINIRLLNVKDEFCEML